MQIYLLIHSLTILFRTNSLSRLLALQPFIQPSNISRSIEVSSSSVRSRMKPKTPSNAICSQIYIIGIKFQNFPTYFHASFNSLCCSFWLTFCCCLMANYIVFVMQIGLVSWNQQFPQNSRLLFRLISSGKLCFGHTM